MELRNPLLAVSDMERSLAFYETVLGLRVVLDFGASKTLTGGLCLQTLETWGAFLGANQVAFGGNDSEVYFEEDQFDAFAERLSTLELQYVHPVKEHAWGQRVVRFYDPDRHIIEVGENMTAVCRRFLDSGMTPEEAAARMDVPVDYVRERTK
ncbi:MAG: glyoxalase [Oscillibacter sp.]|jgi:lactoylglutathione lyase|nr:glyoxalase [Oscillibacter sp.]